MIPNLPDLGNLRAKRNIVNSTTLTSVNNAHNLSLVKETNILQWKPISDTRMVQFGVNFLYQESTKKPAKFGLTNVTNTYLSNLVICDNPKKFLFWHGIHPTTAAHEIFAKAALKTLNIRESHSSQS
jgi:phospholipase/lecithinase/hemolysin